MSNGVTPADQTTIQRDLVWGLASLFLWRILFFVPAILLPAEYQIHAFISGCVLGTSVLLLTHHLLFLGDDPVHWGAPWPMFIYVAIACMGVAIVGKELGNMGLSITGTTVQPADPTQLNVSPVLIACLSSVIYPIAYSLVVVGVLARSLLKHLPAYAALTLTVCVTLIGAPLHAWPRLAFVMFFAVWVFVKTRSLALSAIAYLPATILPLLNALGIGPQILGFDIEDPQRIILQPLWFNLLGISFMIVGVTLLSHNRASRTDGDHR